MFKLMGKKIITILLEKNLINWPHEVISISEGYVLPDCLYLNVTQDFS